MKILKTKFQKLNLSRKTIATSAIIFLLILGFVFWITKKLPLEAKFLINHLESGNIMEDVLNNQEKYKNLPCFELEFNGDKYCFDRSRAFFEKKYLNPTTKKEEGVVVYFIPKVLSGFPPENRSIRIDWRIDEYHRDNINEPEYFVRSAINDSSKNYKLYNEFIAEAADGRFIEITNMMRPERISGDEHFVFLSEKRIMARFQIDLSSHYKMYSQVVFHDPTKKDYLMFGLGSNHQTQVKFLKTLFDVGNEFNQYLADSKIK